MHSTLSPHLSGFAIAWTNGLILLTRTFRSSRTFDCSYSLLGRLVRAWTGDRLRGEALFIVVLTGLGLLLLLAHYLGWALLQPVLTGEGAEAAQLQFWTAQVVSFLVLLAIGVLGLRPPVHARLDDDGLHLSQGNRHLHLTLDDVHDVCVIDARRFHRHYRRYAATRIFASRPGASVLLIDTDGAPVIVALSSEDDQTALRDALQKGTPAVAQESTAATG